MKAIIIISISLLVNISTKCQIIAFNIGTTVSKLDWIVANTRLYADNICGYNIGLGVIFLNKKNYNLQANISTFQKGGAYTFTMTDVLGNDLYYKKEQAKINYISINTIGEFKKLLLKNIYITSKAGPRIDYFLSSKGLIQNDVFNKFAFGGIFGVGITKSLKKISLKLNYDYLINLSAIATTQQYYPFAKNDMKDKTSIIYFSLLYNLKK